jgi:hypothetical protein
VKKRPPASLWQILVGPHQVTRSSSPRSAFARKSSWLTNRQPRSPRRSRSGAGPPKRLDGRACRASTGRREGLRPPPMRAPSAWLDGGRKRNQIGSPRRSRLILAAPAAAHASSCAPSTQRGTSLWQRAWNICHSGIRTGRRRSSSCCWLSRLRPRGATSTTRRALTLSRSLPR